MTRKLALHIGTPKTGTTSCQQWFAGNRDVLRDQGMIYPTSLGEINHRALAIYGADMRGPNRGFAQFDIHTPQDHQRFRTKLRDDFAAEVAKYPQARHWVISNEHLYSQVFRVDAIRRVREFLHPHFSSITIYLHLRPQVDLLVSGASQRARMGKPVSLATLTRDSVSDASLYFNYNLVARHWSEVFGQENLHLVPFRRFPDITGYLIEQLGISCSDTSPVVRVNTALDWQSMSLVNGLGDKAQGLVPLEKTLFLDQLPKGEALQIGEPLARKLTGRFVGSNTALCQRHPEIAMADLVPDWARYKTAANVDKLQENTGFAPQLAYVLRRHQQALQLEQAQGALLAAELALVQGQPEDTAVKLEQAARLLALPACVAALQSRQQGLLAHQHRMQARLIAAQAGENND